MDKKNLRFNNLRNILKRENYKSICYVSTEYQRMTFNFLRCLTFHFVKEKWICYLRKRKSRGRGTPW